MGTDIGGSVRLPTAWTGVATVKPSNGRILIDNPYFGRSAGPLARTVADVALGAFAVARPDECDCTSLPDADIDWFDLDTDVRGRRIAAHINPGAGMPVDADVRDAALRAAGVVDDLRVQDGRAADRVADLGAAVRKFGDVAVHGLVGGGAAGGREAGVSGLRPGVTRVAERLGAATLFEMECKRRCGVRRDGRRGAGACGPAGLGSLDRQVGRPFGISCLGDLESTRGTVLSARRRVSRR